MKERRKCPRLDLETTIIWRKLDTLDNFDRSRNVSEGGICLTSKPEKLKTGDSMPVEFRLPTGKAIHSRVKVIWVGSDKLSGGKVYTGLKFIDIGDLGRQKIRQFIGECRYGCD